MEVLPQAPTRHAHRAQSDSKHPYAELHITFLAQRCSSATASCPPMGRTRRPRKMSMHRSDHGKGRCSAWFDSPVFFPSATSLCSTHSVRSCPIYAKAANADTIRATASQPIAHFRVLPAPPQAPTPMNAAGKTYNTGQSHEIIPTEKRRTMPTAKQILARGFLMVWASSSNRYSDKGSDSQ